MLVFDISDAVNSDADMSLVIVMLNIRYQYRYHVYDQDLYGQVLSSVVNTDPHGSALNWLSEIQVRIGNADPDPGAWKWTKINK
jgi:hypothetical protein